MTGFDPVYSVSDFVAICNQVMDMSFGSVQVTGELSQFRVSKNRWVYFDLKDDFSSVRFFGTVYQLPGPLEDGMLLTVRGVPQLHPRFGFSITVQSLQLAGEGTIKKAAQLLEAKLEKEGLFNVERKRPLPYPPAVIGLVTSGESAAYADFVKIVNQRWRGMKILHADVQVQGERAPGQIVEAINHFNMLATPPEMLVIIRGGGSADDLQAFSTETVTRAVASSRIPTMVAIGHEVDTALAERAADVRASTPSNAAELLTPDRKHFQQVLESANGTLQQYLSDLLARHQDRLADSRAELNELVSIQADEVSREIHHRRQLLELLSPIAVLQRGFAIVRQDEVIVSSAKQFKSSGSPLTIQLRDGSIKVDLKSSRSE